MTAQTATVAAPVSSSSATVTATFKIGNNRGRPRVWLDGPRLARAGFIGGSFYACTAQPGRITCRALAEGEALPPGARKVTGRPDGKPIIDMTGATVALAFPRGDAVRVTFAAGLLTITAA